MAFLTICLRSKSLPLCYSACRLSSASSIHASSLLFPTLNIEQFESQSIQNNTLCKRNYQTFGNLMRKSLSSHFRRRQNTVPTFSSTLTLPCSNMQTLVSHPVQIDNETNKTENHVDASDKKYAVIDIKSKQYKITLDDLIVSDKIHDLDIGENYVCSNVMLLGSQDETIIGQPYIENASVTLSCEEQTKDKKVIIFKKRRRKASQRKNGFRREVTILRVTNIQGAN